MDFGKLAGKLAGLAETFVPLIIPGAGPAIEAGKKLVDLIHDVQPHVAGTPEGQDLQASLDALEARVMEHADATISSLGDGPT